MGRKSLLLVLMLVAAAWVLAGCGGSGGGVDTGALSGFAYMEIITLSGDSERAAQPIVLSTSPTPPDGYEPLFPGTVGGDAGTGVTYPNGSYFLGELPPGLYSITLERPDDPLSLSTYEVEVTKGLVTYGDDEETGEYKGDGYRLIDYFNPVVGKTWYYEPELRGTMPNFGFIRNEVIGDEIGALGLWYGDDDGPCFGDVDGKLALLGLASREPGYLASLDPAVVFPEDIEVGDTAQGLVDVTPVARSESRNGVTSMAFFWAFLGLEDITTPAGAYVDCLHFQMAFTAGAEVDPQDMTDVWFAQGVGPVAWTRAYQDRPTTEYTIESLLLNSIVDESISGPFTMLDYYPMKLGDVRGYSYVDRSAPAKTFSVDSYNRLVGLVQVAGAKAFAQATAHNDGSLDDDLMLMSNDANGLRLYGMITPMGGFAAVNSASNAITIPASVEVGDNDSGSVTLTTDTGFEKEVDYSWFIIGTARMASNLTGPVPCLMLDLRLMPEGETGMRTIMYLAEDYGPIVEEEFEETSPGSGEWETEGLRELGYYDEGDWAATIQPSNPAVYLQNAPGRNWALEDMLSNDFEADIYADTSQGSSQARVEFSATLGRIENTNEAYWFSNGLDDSLSFWARRDVGDDPITFDEPIVIPAGALLGDNWTFDVDDDVTVKVTVTGLFIEPWWSESAAARVTPSSPSSLALKLEVEDPAGSFVKYWFLNQYTGLDRLLDLEVGAPEYYYRYPAAECYDIPS